MGVLLVLLLAVLALLPEPFKGRTATSGLVHECGHVFVFSLAFLLTSMGSRGTREFAILAVLLTFGFGLELLQSRVYHIPIEYRDISANFSGVLLGFLGRSIWIGKTRDEFKE
jgi:hypothetical protein